MSKLGDDFCVRLFSTSPAPKRDYQGLTITTKHVTLNSWDISHGPHTYPRRQHMPLTDFCDDHRFQDEISIIFGKHVVEYILRLARGERNFHLLPEKIVLHILKLLAVNDILNLRQSSKIFFQICNTNPVWKILFQKRLRRPIADWELKQSETMSWKYMLRRSIEKTDSNVIFKNFMKNVADMAVNIKDDSKVPKFTSKIDDLLLPSKDVKLSRQILNKVPERSRKSVWSEKNVGETTHTQENSEKKSNLKSSMLNKNLPKTKKQISFK